MKRDQKWSLFFALLPDWEIISTVYTAVDLIGACKNSRVYKYPPLGSSSSCFMASKKYPLPFKYIVKKITIYSHFEALR